MTIGLHYVSELRHPTGLLFIPQTIYEYGEPQLNDTDGKTPKKTCLNATLPTTNPTWTKLRSKPGLSGERPATNRLSHNMAQSNITLFHQPISFILIISSDINI
jgi:hypothetical protein